MGKFRKKPVVIEAITFEEFVRFAKETTEEPHWHIPYQGVNVTQENDECYIIPTLEGNHNFTPVDMLITGVKGEIYPCKKDIFEATYEAVEEAQLRKYREGSETPEPTFGEIAVGLSFNPSNLSDVDKVKRAFADLIDMCNNISTFTYLGNTLKGMAIRACIEAQMAVVKLITFKEK